MAESLAPTDKEVRRFAREICIAMGSWSEFDRTGYREHLSRNLGNRLPQSGRNLRTLASTLVYEQCVAVIPRFGDHVTVVLDPTAARSALGRMKLPSVNLMSNQTFVGVGKGILDVIEAQEDGRLRRDGNRRPLRILADALEVGISDIKLCLYWLYHLELVRVFSHSATDVYLIEATGKPFETEFLT